MGAVSVRAHQTAAATQPQLDHHRGGGGATLSLCSPATPSPPSRPAGAPSPVQARAAANRRRPEKARAGRVLLTLMAAGITSLRARCADAGQEARWHSADALFCRRRGRLGNGGDTRRIGDVAARGDAHGDEAAAAAGRHRVMAAIGAEMPPTADRGWEAETGGQRGGTDWEAGAPPGEETGDATAGQHRLEGRDRRPARWD